MKILVVDRSGRGHTFADLLTRTNERCEVFYAPGCQAVDTDRITAVQELSLADPDAMVSFARARDVDLALITNTQALVDGFVDAFRAAGLAVIGPDRAASRLEASKVEAKALFREYGIPTPEHRSFDDPAQARAFIQQVGHQVVVKADGLCGGNGSFVCDDVDDASAAIERLMVQRVCGPSGDQVVVERRIYGQEFSFFALLDGFGYLTLPMALDYPKSDDGNRGVVSGGMGAVSHHPLETPAIIEKVENLILGPLLRCIRERGLRYTGVIYLGCMLVGDSPVLLEVNARMGEPEAEVVLSRIESDFVAICHAVLQGRVAQQSLVLNDLHFCDVVATQGPTAAGGPGASPGHFPGWPFGAFGRGFPITGLDRVDRATCRPIVGEATVRPALGLTTDGGRPLHILGWGANREQAAESAYRNIKCVSFEGMRYRRDIGRTMPWEAPIAG